MKNRRNVSPYYISKAFQFTNPHLKSSSWSQERSIRLQSQTTATAEDESSHKSSRKSSLNSGKQEMSFEHMVLGKGGIKVVPLANRELFKYSIQFQSQNKSCQTSPSMKRSTKPKRVASEKFFSLSQQMMNKS